MKYGRIYHLLCAHGHSPSHAVKIILDAKRKDDWALRWIIRAHEMTHRTIWIERKQKVPVKVAAMKPLEIRIR